MIRWCTWLLLVVSAAMPTWAQTAPPDAGALLRQTERDREAAPPPPRPQLPLARAPQAAGATDEGTHVTVRAFELHGNRLVAGADLQALLAPWLGRPIGLGELRRATQAVQDEYRQRGWLAQATLPAQDISGGAVRIEIVEARLGRIEFTPSGGSTVAPRLLDHVRLSLTLATVDASGNLTLASQGALEFGPTSVGGNLAATSGGGAIGQNGSISVHGSSDLEAGAGTIALGAAGNQFGGPVKAAGDSVNIVNPAAGGGASLGSLGATATASTASGTGGASSGGGTPAALGQSLTAADGYEGRLVAAAAPTDGVNVTELQPVGPAALGVVDVSLSSPVVKAGSFEFTLPEQAANALAAGGAPVQASLPDSSPLPGWLAFDPTTLMFTAKDLPPGSLPLRVMVRSGRLAVLVEVSEASALH